MSFQMADKGKKKLFIGILHMPVFGLECKTVNFLISKWHCL